MTAWTTWAIRTAAVGRQRSHTEYADREPKCSRSGSMGAGLGQRSPESRGTSNCGLGCTPCAGSFGSGLAVAAPHLSDLLHAVAAPMVKPARMALAPSQVGRYLGESFAETARTSPIAWLSGNPGKSRPSFGRRRA